MNLFRELNYYETHFFWKAFQLLFFCQPPYIFSCANVLTYQSKSKCITTYKSYDHCDSTMTQMWPKFESTVSETQILLPTMCRKKSHTVFTVKLLYVTGRQDTKNTTWQSSCNEIKLYPFGRRCNCVNFNIAVTSHLHIILLGKLQCIFINNTGVQTQHTFWRDFKIKACTFFILEPNVPIILFRKNRRLFVHD